MRSVPVALCLAVLALHAPPVVTASGQARENKRVANLVEKAEELDKAGAVEEAILAYEKADGAAGGTSWVPQVALARLYLQLRSPEEALRFAELARDSAGLPSERAVALELAGRAREASALQLSDPDVAASKAEALQEAASLFEEALTTEADAAIDSLYYLGTIRERLGAADEAARLYERYREARPQGDKVGAALLHLNGLSLPAAERPRYVSGDMSPPTKLSAPQPQYTREARRARTRGMIALETVIDTSGRVSKLALLNELPNGLTGATVEAIRLWTFEPATLGDGTPVPVYYVLTVSFDLQ